ncbi:coiled-coil domain-containing protein 22 isoform X1 [Tripterygium wilfordii]|uniref:Coiled-coil domain-containing protein 22 isoform X1 n=1 Tax=Tripterygium wilfordii TaxID=458696 RepID=A0A7J7C2Y7_TRIWF|nr:coiled-coil domain-containing protein 22 [Tripterygium wilfordii]KAF5728478.1 coiled-coil domain-containing protein 22 isoform X1 [Tripterygium wilfordii]
MEESQEILLNSLENAGVLVPDDVASIRDLSPMALASICAQCLNIIQPRTATFPTTLPDSMVDKFKVCTDMALAVKKLGFSGDMSYYKFLYPTEEDLYKLVRFLVERLPKLSEGVEIVKPKENKLKSASEDLIVEADIENHLEIGARLEDLRLNTEGQPSTNFKAKVSSLSGSYEDPLAVNSIVDSGTQGSGRGNDSTEDPPESGQGAFGVEGTVVENKLQVISLQQQASEIIEETEMLQNQGKDLTEELTAKTSELQHLDEELKLLREAAEMGFDDQYPIDHYFEQLNKQIDAKKQNITEMELQWEAIKKPLAEKKKSLLESLCVNNPEALEIFHKLSEVELEKQSVLSEVKKREEEHAKLSSDLKKQPKQASRGSYIQRIKEITKNSRKQDADIERILIETRKLQLESNSIQESLHRTFAFVDELVFREAKKDPVGRQAYKLLTSIHDTFEQISDKILATDRIRREVAEHEKKLSTMTSQSLHMHKLQADIDAIVKENEYLEQRIRD